MTKSLNTIYNESLKLVDNKNVFKQDILFLMEEEFHITYNDLFIYGDKEVETKEYDAKLKRLNNGEPVEYILHKAIFFNEEYYVDENVLIPRNCTEELIEKIKGYTSKLKMDISSIIDIGSGSGCIGITLKKIYPSALTESVDISEKAIEIAKKNAFLRGMEVNFYKSDCLEEPIKEHKKYDLIVSNPPYIDVDTYVQESVLKYEPHLALFAQNHGMAIYEKIFSEIPLVDKNHTLIALEISPDLEERLVALKDRYLPDYSYSFEKDMNDFVRFMFLYK